MYMSQLNINMTPEFEALLLQYMELNNIRHKSEAIRHALQVVVAKQEAERARGYDFSQWSKVGKRSRKNPSPRFRTHDDLWEKKK